MDLSLGFLKVEVVAQGEAGLDQQPAQLVRPGCFRFGQRQDTSERRNFTQKDDLVNGLVLLGTFTGNPWVFTIKIFGFSCQFSPKPIR